MWKDKSFELGKLSSKRRRNHWKVPDTFSKEQKVEWKESKVEKGEIVDSLKTLIWYVTKTKLLSKLVQEVEKWDLFKRMLWGFFAEFFLQGLIIGFHGTIIRGSNKNKKHSRLGIGVVRHSWEGGCFKVLSKFTTKARKVILTFGVYIQQGKVHQCICNLGEENCRHWQATVITQLWSLHRVQMWECSGHRRPGA